MEVFQETLDRIEKDYLLKINHLKNLKDGAILIGIISLLYGSLELFKLKEKYDYTDIQIAGISFFLALVVMIPILTTPLCKLISSKEIREKNWIIKSSIFNYGLKKFTTNYKFSFEHTLLEKELKNLKLIDNQFSSYKGNDLIIGEIKGHKFKISDIHAFSLRKRKFDGLVGVIYFKEIENAEDFYRRISLKMPINGQLKMIDKSVYLLMQGNREHFEIQFFKQGINKDKLVSDFKFFDSFVDLFFKEL